MSSFSIMHAFDPLDCPLRGCVFIEASAGTGKTHSITSLVLRLVLEKNVEMKEFLLVTYTNAATDELGRKTRERFHLALRQLNDTLPDDLAPDPLVTDLLKEQRIETTTAIKSLRDALLNFDELAILTIHGFCQRLLRDRAFESGQMFDTELEPDEASLLQDTLHDFWRLLVERQNESFFSYLRQKKLGLPALMDLARTAMSQADADIVPESNEEAPHADLKSWEDLIAEVQAFLDSNENEILATINEAKLNGRVYQAKRTITWLADVRDWLAEPFPLPSTCDKLSRFTNTKLVENTKDGETPPSHAFFDLCDNLSDQGEVLEAMLEHQWVETKRDLLLFLRQRLPERKQLLNRFAYEDLLQNARQALQEESGTLAASLGQQYPIILIDEFQDTDPTQYAIFKHLHDSEDHRLLCLIGDPKQAIYAFRGGDIFTYTHARKQADHLATLGENWRSSPGLIEAVNTVYRVAPRPFWSAAIDYHVVNSPPISLDDRQRTLVGEDADIAPMQLWQISEKGPREAEQQCVEATCQEIARLVQLGRDQALHVNGHAVAPSDIAILIRSHWQAPAFQECLQQLDVKTVSYERQHLFQTKEAECFDIFLRVLASPRDENLLKALLLSELMGFTNEDLKLALTDEGRWGSLLEMIGSYRAQWRAESFIVMFRRFLREEYLSQRLLALPNGERSLTNILHLSELVEEAQASKKLSIHATLQWYQDERDSSLSDEKELRLESDDDRVKIVTVHRSKGLEYPFVFMPYAWMGTDRSRKDKDYVSFHQAEQHGHRRVIDVGSESFDTHRSQAGEEALEEELRLLYVALTRAQHRVYLLFAPETKKYKASSLAYLWHHLESDLEGSLSDVKDRLERHTPMRFREDLAKLVGASNGTIALGTWENRNQVTLSQHESERAQAPRQFQAQPSRNWGITSYSSLVGHGETLETPDRDAPDPLPAPEIPAEQLSGMDALPRGARTGNMLHAIYENLSFQASAEAIHTEAKKQLEVHGLSVDDWLGELTHHTLDFFHSDLDGFRLADISDRQRLNELAFHFPIGNLTVARLEQFFEEHQLLSRQNAFDFFPVEGFLKGFIDLVIQHEGRYFIADYKSNFLGGHAEDYHHERLPSVMAESNYVLQYHLYVVALHRFLSYRLGNTYDYDTHFGGVRYLFVRGISQESSPMFGVFTDRPSASLIEDLSQFLTGPQEVAHG